jgi:hypothetical protein
MYYESQEEKIRQKDDKRSNVYYNDATKELKRLRQIGLGETNAQETYKYPA